MYPTSTSNPVAYNGVQAQTPSETKILNHAPTARDYNWNLNTWWLDRSTNTVYVLVNKNNLIADWRPLVTGTSINVNSINLPDTTANFGVGYISFGGTPFIHDFGTRNTFIGKESGSYGTINNILTGTGNTCIGESSGENLENATNNCLFGYAVGTLIQNGSENCIFGALAGQSVNGNANIIIGVESAINYTGTESNNICISNPGVTGEENAMHLGTEYNGLSGIEFSYLAGISTNISNTQNNDVGTLLEFNKSRASAIVQNGDVLGTIGFNGWDGNSYTNGASINAIVTAAPADESIPTSLAFAIGSTAAMIIDHTRKVTINGSFSAGVNPATTIIFPQVPTTIINDLVVNIDQTTGQLGTPTSSRRYKINIEDLGSDSESIFALRPVSFEYKGDYKHRTYMGLIAEEVEEVLPRLVNYKDNLPDSVRYQDLPVLLLNEIKKQQKKIEKLEKRLLTLEK